MASKLGCAATIAQSGGDSRDGMGDKLTFGKSKNTGHGDGSHIEKQPAKHSRMPADRSKSARQPMIKMTPKMLGSMDVLSLDHIANLSEKALLELFAEFSSDEMARNYIYTCCLMPSKCHASFKSFGSESKARINVISHLQGHVSELIDDANDPSKSHKIKFTAEPLPARYRRLNNCSKVSKKTSASKENESVCKKKSDTKENEPAQPPAAALAAFPVNSPSASQTAPTREENQNSKSAAAPSKPVVKKAAKGCTANKVKSSRAAAETKNESTALKRKSPSPGPADGRDTSCAKLPRLTVSSGASQRENRDKPKPSWSSKRKHRQPYADHCYFSGNSSSGLCEHKDDGSATDSDNDEEEVTASRTGRPHMARRFQPASGAICDAMQAQSDHIDVDLASPYSVMTVKIKTGYLLTCNKVTIPIMQLAPVVPGEESVAAVGAEVTVETDENGEEPGQISGKLARPYPPMPKYPVQHGTRMVVAEEEMSFSSDEGDLDEAGVLDKECDVASSSEATQPQQLDDTFKATVQTEAGLDWERKLAIKCIRELKSGEARYASNHLRCKVCEKTFTASATLMYHYRSHAGIKPFICLLCNATFTRQHSLNYHMLIHTGQSRFKCPDCGRAFRHPSHFKEHQRRHTGETPFECMDCTMKFKTRNTFKRHLKTRHSKLLTASGIRSVDGAIAGRRSKSATSPPGSSCSENPSKDIEIDDNNSKNSCENEEYSDDDAATNKSVTSDQS